MVKYDDLEKLIKIYGDNYEYKVNANYASVTVLFPLITFKFYREGESKSYINTPDAKQGVVEFKEEVDQKTCAPLNPNFKEWGEWTRLGEWHFKVVETKLFANTQLPIHYNIHQFGDRNEVEI